MSIKIPFLALSTLLLVSCGSQSPSSESTSKTTTAPTTVTTTTPAAVTTTTPDPKPDLEQQRTAAILQQRQQEYSLLTEKMSGQQQRIKELTGQADRLDAELSEFNNKVKAYMLENKTEVACMGAFGMSLDKTNEYSKDAKDVAALVTLGCGVGVLSNGEFAGNVGKVFNQLVKAGTHSNDLKMRLTDTRSRLTAETTALNESQTQAQTLATEIKR